MAFSVDVPQEIIDASKQFVVNNNLGIRNDNSNGTKDQQLVGVIGQNMMARALGRPLMQPSTGHDGGIDFVINGKTIDIKTMGRTRTPKLDYVNNLIASQIKFDVDGYVFASFNKETNKLTICGWLPKPSFLFFANFNKKGTVRTRNDNTTFELKADTYEIENEDLIYKIYCWQDLIKSISQYDKRTNKTLRKTGTAGMHPMPSVRSEEYR